ncbi:CUGBP Elav-like family member 3-B isoform X2 [Halichondria panicea]|uniref:CUGBP Elav-like family member 3-B isoform X2 n=1 Tax=Halichondria panicea TaxID=6063 RepID=UPI00312B65FE
MDIKISVEEECMEGSLTSYCKDVEMVKLFVGQVPRSWEDGELRDVMETYGPIQELTILKDRTDGTSKGCAFVTFMSGQSAIEAQKALHEKRTLPGMSHPMQVKPAAVDAKATPVEERRLFVGMLCRNLSEDDVKALFNTYGAVDDVSILRNADGKSKGAAFVRMSNKDEARDAISGLHGSQTMPGCSAPLVVKIADTEREKNAKRLQAVKADGITAALGSMQTAAYFKMHQGGIVPAPVNNSFGLGTSLHNPMVNSSLGNLSSAMLTAAAPLPAGFHPAKMIHPLTNDAILSAYLGMQNPMTAQFAATYATTPAVTNQQNNSNSPSYSKQKEGPDGSNLFIYHLPNEVMDPDLAQMFSPFGAVLSAKVFIDKATNLSKCFGFVSYDNALSAQSAIQSMNGFQIGTKRLKVQLKRPRESTRPY